MLAAIKDYDYSAPAEARVVNSGKNPGVQGKAYHYCTGCGDSTAELHRKAVTDALSRRSKTYADKLDLLKNMLPATVSPSDSEPEFIKSI